MILLHTVKIARSEAWTAAWIWGYPKPSQIGGVAKGYGHDVNRKGYPTQASKTNGTC